MRRSALCAAVLTTVLAASAGCRNLATLAVYLVRGTEVAAEYNGLKEKRVAVVCRPVASLAFRDAGVSGELTRRMTTMLGERIRKIDAVGSQEVAAWVDERYDSDYTFEEVGEAFDADRVLGVELLDFTLYKGQTLYQGNATVRVVVYERDEETSEYRVGFEREVPPIVWPPNIGVPTGERSKSEFTRQFIEVVADHVGRYFYSHDPYSDYAQDAAAMQQ